MGIRTALFSRNQPGGVFTVDDLKEHPGDIYFVHSGTGVNAAGYGNSPDAPVATVDYAIGLCTAGKGDVIYVMPGHAETTTAIALDVAGVKIVGLGYGANRPTLTATTAATDLINVTAANCVIQGLRLVGAASGNTALLDLSSAATDFVAEGCEFVQAATPLDGVTISGTRFRFSDCVFRGSANGPDRVFSIEGADVDNWVIERCRFHYPSGLDNELIKCVKISEGYIIQDIVVVGVDTLLVNFSSSSAGAPDGLMAKAHVMASAALTSIEDMVASATSKGMAFSQVFATDATAKVSGRIPLTTAS
jgi:hypothetical protein